MGRNKVLIVVIVFLGVFIFGAWQLLMLRTKQQASATSLDASASQAPSTLVTIDLPLILHHRAQGATHTYTGSVWLPNACDALSDGLSAQGVRPSHITIHLSIDGMTCPSATKTQADFSVSFAGADTKAPIIDAVTFNGMEIPYTLVEDK